MFSAATAPKVKRLAANPRATLLVANEVAEPEFWVAIQGTIEATSERALDTVEQLADRYWGSEPSEMKAKTLNHWRANAAHLVALHLTAAKISSGAG